MKYLVQYKTKFGWITFSNPSYGNTSFGGEFKTWAKARDRAKTLRRMGWNKGYIRVAEVKPLKVF